MKILDLFKSVQFCIGFILGVALLYLVITDCYATGFKSEFIWYYFVIFALLLVAEGNSVQFFIGLGIPYLVLMLLLFFYVDMKHKNENKPYRNWKL